MADSLRDQLLALGLAKAPPPREEQRGDRGDRGNRNDRGDRPRAPGASDARRDGPSSQRPGQNARGPQGQRPANAPKRDRPANASPGQRHGPGPGGNAPRPGQGARPAAAPKPPRAPGEPDLAQAYAARARTEREERERAERAAAEAAREKKARKEKLQQLLDGQALNDPAADQARHFPQGDKIRRVYVNAEQLRQLNAGELGVVQWSGRYLLVRRDIALAAQAIAAESLLLLPDPDAPAEDDIPPDLVW